MMETGRDEVRHGEDGQSTSRGPRMGLKGLREGSERHRPDNAMRQQENDERMPLSTTAAMSSLVGTSGEHSPGKVHSQKPNESAEEISENTLYGEASPREAIGGAQKTAEVHLLPLSPLVRPDALSRTDGDYGCAGSRSGGVAGVRRGAGGSGGVRWGAAGCGWKWPGVAGCTEVPRRVTGCSKA